MYDSMKRVCLANRSGGPLRFLYSSISFHYWVIRWGLKVMRWNMFSMDFFIILLFWNHVVLDRSILNLYFVFKLDSIPRVSFSFLRLPEKQNSYLFFNIQSWTATYWPTERATNHFSNSLPITSLLLCLSTSSLLFFYLGTSTSQEV